MPRRVGRRNGEQPSSIFSSQHACPEGPLQCWRGDGSSFSFSIEGAPHYRPSGKIILTRLDGPPSSLPPTHRPRDGPGGISTHDQHCGCASLHFQPMTNTAAAPRFTFNPCRTLQLRLPSLSPHDGHGGCAARHFQPMTNTAAALRFTFNAGRTPLRGSLGWPTGRPRGWPRHACEMHRYQREQGGMPAGDACGMPAACLQACLRPAGMLQACLQACLRVAQACGSRHAIC